MFVFDSRVRVWDFQNLQDVLCQPVRVVAPACASVFVECVCARAQVGLVIKVISV